MQLMCPLWSLCEGLQKERSVLPTHTKPSASFHQRTSNSYYEVKQDEWKGTVVETNESHGDEPYFEIIFFSHEINWLLFQINYVYREFSSLQAIIFIVMDVLRRVLKHLRLSDGFPTKWCVLNWPSHCYSFEQSGDS